MCKKLAAKESKQRNEIHYSALSFPCLDSFVGGLFEIPHLLRLMRHPTASQTTNVTNEIKAPQRAPLAM